MYILPQAFVAKINRNFPIPERQKLVVSF